MSGIIRTNMDAGYPKIRRRFTAITSTMSVAFSMTKTQFDAFETWFANSVTGISYGASKFYFPNPMWIPAGNETENDRPNIVVRFKIEGQPYTVVPDGETRDLIISFSIERMPEDA